MLKKLLSLVMSIAVIGAGLIFPAAEVKAVLSLTPYDCYQRLNFDGTWPSGDMWDPNGVLTFVKSDPDYPAHSGNGALHVKGKTGFSIWGGANGSGPNMPKVGDEIAGYFYFKKLTQPPGSWQYPKVRLYAEVGGQDFCITKDLNTASVWAAPLNEWTRVELVSTGKKVSAADLDAGLIKMQFEIVGSNADGDVDIDYILDDVTFCRMDGDSELGVPAIATPNIQEYQIANGDFEHQDTVTLYASNWGRYTPNESAVENSPPFLNYIKDASVTEAGSAQSGNAMIEVIRGGSSWNIFAAGDNTPKIGDRVGGYFWLYVPQGADLKLIPWVECKYNVPKDGGGNEEKVAATSAGYSSSNIKFNQWNKIPITPTVSGSPNAVIPNNAVNTLTMIMGTQVNSGNPVYNVPFYIDNIHLGKIEDGVSISEDTTLCDASLNPIEGIRVNDDTINAKIFVNNSKEENKFDISAFVAVYKNNKLVSTGNNIRAAIAGKGETGLSTTMFDVSASISGIDKAGLTAKIFLWDGNSTMTPYSGSFELIKDITIVPFDDENIKYIGRWTNDTASAKSAWGGAYFKTRFSGKNIKLNLGGSADIYVSIDGGDDVRYTISGAKVLDITPAGLEDGIHTLRVASRNTFDSINLKNIILDGGSSLSLPDVSNKLIEFIGDSNTAGYLLERNALDNYSWLVSEGFGVEHVHIAYTGMALSDGLDNSNINRDMGMSAQFFKTHPLDERSAADWDFTAYTPDVVVINLGGNDGNAAAVPGGKAALEQQLPGFLENIRAKYALAQIIVLIPTSEVPFPVADEINNGVAKYKSDSSDTKVDVYNARAWIENNLGRNLLSDGVHLSQTGNEVVAEKLYDILGQYLDN